MKQGISLCIAYNFQVPGVVPTKSLYRIADYENGCFYEVDTMNFSDFTDDFNPKYLRYRPGEELPYYQPVVYEWQAIAKYGDFSKYTTESFPNDNIKVFEIIINPEFLGGDTDKIISALRQGISFPEGVADNILIAFDQDDEFYQVVYCNKSYFKCVDGKYYIEGKIEDVLHMRHSLDVYYIDKDDIINTSNFGYFYTLEGTQAATRYFYMYDELPQPDWRLYLYRFEEYLPVYLAKYFRNHAKETGLTKNNIQIAINIVREALSNELEMKEFFSVSGYELSDFEERLPKYEDIVIKSLNGSGFLNNIVTRILMENDEIKEKLFLSAKMEWLQKADREREIAELTLNEYEEKQNIAAQKKEELEKLYLQLDEKYKYLSDQYTSTVTAINTTVNEFEKHIGEYLADNVIYKLINQSKVNDIVVSQDTGVMITLPDYENDVKKYIVSDVSKACKALEANLRIAGMSAQYSMILSNIFIASDALYRSLIVSGEHARELADAFAYSIDGNAAARITITNTTVNYKDVYDAVKRVGGKVILVENILDTCNELTYVALNKDFPEKLFFFNIENEGTLSLLSKSIWNYGLLVNTDTSILNGSTNQPFKAIDRGDKFDLRKTETDISNYQNIMQLLEKFELPVVAKRNFVRTMAYFIENKKIIDPEEYIDSVIAKYCEIYKKSIEPEIIDEIREVLNKNIKLIYGF